MIIMIPQMEYTDTSAVAAQFFNHTFHSEVFFKKWNFFL